MTLLISSSQYALAQMISETEKVEIKGSYTNPIPSPDGNFVLLSGDQLNGIALLNMKTKSITPISDADGSGYGYTWSNDSQTIYFKVKPENAYVMDSEVFSYNIKTRKRSKVDINHNYLPSYNGENNIVVYTNIRTLKIEAIDLRTKKSWVVTNNDGQFYSATLSHDGKKVAVHEGSSVYVYNIDGSGVIAKLGMGIATSWSMDDKYLVGYLSESPDGHVVTNSDLYLFNVETSRAEKLTNTKDNLEAEPSFMGKDKIIYVDEKNGQILISNIKI
nr:hypothetical protein [uncultured Flavobacterium sp.]